MFMDDVVYYFVDYELVWGVYEFVNYWCKVVFRMKVIWEMDYVIV